jgi:myo-inositol-1(or 4)-monophosphatase
MTIDIENLLIEASYKAGHHLRKNAFNPGNIEWKSQNDPVTQRDTEAESIIIDTILSKIDMNITCEESTKLINNPNNKYRAYIDPLDGTKSYLRRDFESSVSIAIEEDQKLIAGAVYDFMRDILYLGVRGENKILHDGEQFKFKTDFSHQKTAILTNLNYDYLNHKNLKKLRTLENHPNYYICRRKGSIALNLAHTAIGTYDSIILFPKGVSSSWDFAAGTYLLQSANFQISDVSNQPFNFRIPTNGIMATKNNNKQK